MTLHRHQLEVGVNEILTQNKISGPTLDFGGDRSIDYGVLPSDRYIINVDSSASPDLLCDITQPWPVTLVKEVQKAKLIVLSELLEHLFDIEDFWNQLASHIKSGTHILISTPFVYHEHGDPFDYRRFTETYLIYLCKRSGWEVVQSRKIGTLGTVVVDLIEKFHPRSKNKKIILYFVKKLLMNQEKNKNSNRVYSGTIILAKATL
ncbi:methyltransferase domain-containing protein [Roseibium polysiphoniae]|uniref:Methyltransferase domain-containing protein n=1 Tax=Roseibium polysiphoniae TaxID=2571221 RepID=A0ABR9C779_9HYPH|nr:methyltransferase domain-containing protein [Roseibium polysiphoniae]MBD8874955.1 hypothetical protein [Roseibium polysiphoniae]